MSIRTLPLRFRGNLHRINWYQSRILDYNEVALRSSTGDDRVGFRPDPCQRASRVQFLVGHTAVGDEICC
jgi:hypothetical protein